MRTDIPFDFANEPDRFELREAVPYSFAPNRREFLEFAGAGLLILVGSSELTAQRGGGPATLEARLHIGEDGAVTVLTGKIEEGQGARTEIAMAAAEELRLPVGKVHVVTADTDSTPNDGTTAGSRTTPSTIPAVRLAGAAARDLLLAEAARQWSTDRAGLLVKDGVVTAKDGRKFGYADLARSPELAKAYKNALPQGVQVTPASEWRTLGQPQLPVNARAIVTGAHQYPSDTVRPGMLYGAVLRPPSFGATLTALNADAAKKLPGVTVAHEGDFAGCAAPNAYAARKAVAALSAGASWKEQPHPSSRELFTHLKKNADPGQRSRPQNKGDLEAGLAKAAKKLAASYEVAYVQHAPMEPRAAVAEWNDGKLTVWTGTSNPFSVRGQLAEAFHIPQERIRVIVPDMGGGFGGKHTGEAAIEAARLAKEAGRPVSLRWTRAEEFTWAYARPAALIEVRAGLDSNGAIAAWEFKNYNSGGSALQSPYRLANTSEVYIPSDSPLRQGSYRCLAATANNFARESFMDELAADAGADPLDFRLAHLDNQRIKDVLTAAAKKFNWAERYKQRKPGRGVGLACGTEKNSVVAACVEVGLDESTGEPRLYEICEAFECGAILNPAGLRQQVEGCIMMGLGAALREELLFENGRVTNARFSAYRVPRFKDLPKMDLIFLDRKDQEPVGAGETPIIAVAPAIANAVFQITGERIRTMPVRAKQRKS